MSRSHLPVLQATSHGHPVTSGIDSSVMNHYISWAAAELPTAQEHDRHLSPLRYNAATGLCFRWFCFSPLPTATYCYLPLPTVAYRYLPTVQEHYTEQLQLLPAHSMHQYYERRSLDGVSQNDGQPFAQLTRANFSHLAPASGHWCPPPLLSRRRSAVVS